MSHSTSQVTAHSPLRRDTRESGVWREAVALTVIMGATLIIYLSRFTQIRNTPYVPHRGPPAAHTRVHAPPSVQAAHTTVYTNRRQRTRTGNSAWKNDRDSEPTTYHASDPANGSTMILSACTLAM